VCKAAADRAERSNWKCTRKSAELLVHTTLPPPATLVWKPLWAVWLSVAVKTPNLTLLAQWLASGFWGQEVSMGRGEQFFCGCLNNFRIVWSLQALKMISCCTLPMAFGKLEATEGRHFTCLLRMWDWAVTWHSEGKHQRPAPYLMQMGLGCYHVTSSQALKDPACWFQGPGLQPAKIL
jgi:hypothetical protein